MTNFELVFVFTQENTFQVDTQRRYKIDMTLKSY